MFEDLKRFARAVLTDATRMARSWRLSSASQSSSLRPVVVETMRASSMIRNQCSVSSASSAATARFAMNSSREHARRAEWKFRHFARARSGQLPGKRLRRPIEGQSPSEPHDAGGEPSQSFGQFICLRAHAAANCRDRADAKSLIISCLAHERSQFLRPAPPSQIQFLKSLIPKIPNFDSLCLRLGVFDRMI